MNIEFLLFLLVAVVESNQVLRSTKSGCPESVDVKPCTCSNSPYTYVQCQHLDDAEVLRKVFYNSTGYKFKEVHIEYSSLAFLPYDIFEKVPVRELHLKNVTLSKLFDVAPKDLENLDVLHIENTRIIRGVAWELLVPLTQLRILNIYYNSIKILGKDFSEHATKNLKQLTFYSTGTRTIKPGVFKDFVELDKVAFDDCKLTEINRNIFPSPFNVRVLYFSKNNLKSIPDDMFTNMPKLQTVGLRDNHLTVVPASAFQGSLENIDFFLLEGNPLICDCRLAWLIKSKPPALSGTCDLPSKYQGRKLAELDPSEYNC